MMEVPHFSTLEISSAHVLGLRMENNSSSTSLTKLKLKFYLTTLGIKILLLSFARYAFFLSS
jgi:hypothetical protein